MKRAIKTLISAVLTATILSSTVCVFAFSDTHGHWAETYINEMSTKSYLTGYPDNTFRPDEPITTGEYATILSKVFDLPTYDNPESIFSDVKNSDWYAPYATTYEFLSPYGGDGALHGDEPIVRRDAAFSLCELFYFPVSRSNSASTMADYNSYASDEYTCLIVSTAIDNGLMTGTDAGFEPFKTLSRAELCTVIWRAVENIGIEQTEDIKITLEQIIANFKFADEEGISKFIPDELVGEDPYAENSFSEDASSDDKDSDNNVDENFEHTVLDLVNEYRATEGLAPLVWDDALANTARKHSEDMAARNFVDHINPDGDSPADRLDKDGISYRTAGENIAAGQKTPQSVVEDWMNSPEHRSNIMSPNFKKLGVGIAYGGEYGIYWTQCFTD